MSCFKTFIYNIEQKVIGNHSQVDHTITKALIAKTDIKALCVTKVRSNYDIIYVKPYTADYSINDLIDLVCKASNEPPIHVCQNGVLAEMTQHHFLTYCEKNKIPLLYDHGNRVSLKDFGVKRTA